VNTTAVIAVVAGDEALRDSLAVLLECHGFGVREFSTVAAFLADCHLDQVGCALVHLCRPGVDVLGLLHALCQRGGNTPVVALLGESGVKADALSAGAAFVLDIPVAEGALLSAVRTVWAASGSGSLGVRVGEGSK
jgi:two-component system, LuxR family, response regulator FixJ